MMPTDFATSIHRFFNQYLSNERGFSSNTIDSYKYLFKNLLRFARQEKQINEEKLSISDINKSFIIDFLYWLETYCKCSIHTRNQRLALLHSFFKFLQTEMPDKILQFQEIISTPYKKMVTKNIDFLTVKDLNSLFAQPDTRIKNQRKHLIILSLLYNTAARVQEIVDLKVGDIILQEKITIIRITGKGNKIRLVPIDFQMSEMLNQYLADFSINHKLDHDSLLFKNKYNSKYTRQGITYLIKRYYSQAVQKLLITNQITITPHILRHSRAIHLLESGVDLIYIRDILGHTSVQTTEKYARINTETKRKALEKVSKNISHPNLPEWNTDQNLLAWLNSFKKK
jgi:site-specific recombinase XerD